jgi:hypothetical protein
MTRHRQYRATPQALAAARRLGLYGKTESRLSRMARRAAPITCEWGNRRFQDYVLFVEDDQILDVTRLDFSTAAE